MKIKVKKLKGPEFDLEVEPSTIIADVKRDLSLKIRVSVSKLKLLLAGRTLADDQPIGNYPNIKDGTKLNLVVMKPEDFFDASVRFIRRLGFSEIEAVVITQRVEEVIDEKLSLMSLDDIDKLCADCLRLERRELPPDPDEEIYQAIEMEPGEEREEPIESEEEDFSHFWT